MIVPFMTPTQTYPSYPTIFHLIHIMSKPPVCVNLVVVGVNSYL